MNTDMKNLNGLKLRELQPSQFYISEKKLSDVGNWFNSNDLAGFEPIPVKMLDDSLVITDGHTRAVAALLAGLESVPLIWDNDELDWKMYRRCVEECRMRGIHSPEDLLERIISEADYHEKWHKWCDSMQESLKSIEINVVLFTEDKIQDVLEFEKHLREEEDFWGWEIDEQYIRRVEASFHSIAFDNAISLLAYADNHVVGRIDAVLLPSHFDGSVKAYLDWICVLKSYRHNGIAQKLLSKLLDRLKDEKVDTLIALTASNEEAQNFYKAIPNSQMKDIGIWIDIK